MKIRRECNAAFVIVPNAVYDDERISIEAKGLLGYLLSRPDNWMVRHKQLQGVLRIGRERLERSIRELIAAGYIDREDEQPRDNENRFTSYDYVVRNVPTTREPLSGFPLRGSRCRKPDNGNKKENRNTDSNKTPSQLSPADAPQEVAEQELTEFGRQASQHGLRFVYEDSKPFEAWRSFRGDDGLPLADVVTDRGVPRRGVWLPSLFPPTRSGNGSDAQ
jgi:hypothetical protein